MALRFVVPPNWPQPQQGWEPPSGWTPDPAWGPAPDGWQFWVETREAPAVAASSPAPWERPQPETPLPSVALTIVITALFGLFGLIPTLMHAERAKRAGSPAGKYWVAFGASLAGSAGLWVLLWVVAVAALVTGASTAGVAAAGQPSGGFSVPNSPTAARTPTAGDGTNGNCAYTQAPSGNPNLKDVGTPPSQVPTSGTTEVTMTTNFGAIPLTLDHAEAPCATESFVYLAQKKFFDNTICHRETSSEGLKVLQCGDPSGTGSGGPSYQYKTHTTGKETYQRGTIAMANSGQGFDGSQFFLVYGDSRLPPDFTVIGAVDDAGLSVLDGIAANGNDGANGPDDGAPTQPVAIASMAVG